MSAKKPQKKPAGTKFAPKGKKQDRDSSFKSPKTFTNGGTKPTFKSGPKSSSKTGTKQPFKTESNHADRTDSKPAFKSFGKSLTGANAGSRNDGKGRSTNKSEQLVPNVFKFAAETLKTMSERGGSAGSIVVKNYKSYNYKYVYALAMNTIKNIKIIKKIIHEIKLMKKLPLINNPFLLEIMVGDLLYGRGLKTIEQSTAAAAMMKFKDAIVKQQELLKKDYKNFSDEDGAKYIRVNKVKSNIASVMSQLKTCGLTQVEYSKDKIKFKKFINKFKTMEDNEFMLDFHFPEDLVIVKNTALDKIKKTELLKKGKAILQDKASFMAVDVVSAEPGQRIIDGCCAPGGKTSTMGSRMNNKGKIYGFDNNKARLLAAKQLLKVHGISCVKLEVEDFSKVKLRRLAKTENVDKFDCILLDPSCSGSGIKGRLDYSSTHSEVGRLKKLQAFQVSLLKYALKADVSRSIVYCTCSTSVEENEQVIEMALNESGVKSEWEVVEALPYWQTRGKPEYEFGLKCIRSDETCLTNGFFIARLQYKGKSNGVATTTDLAEDQTQPKKKSAAKEEEEDDDDDDVLDDDEDEFKEAEDEDDDEDDEDEEADEEEDEEIDSDEEDSAECDEDDDSEL